MSVDALHVHGWDVTQITDRLPSVAERHPSASPSRCESLHMLDRFGLPARHTGGDGAFAPDGIERCDDDTADVALIRRTSAWLRTDGDGAWAAGLTCEKDVRAMAALLDMLATELTGMDPAVRRATVDWCRMALGEAHPDPGNGWSPPPGRPTP